MKEIENYLSLMAKEIGWKKMTIKQKLILIWLGLSLALVFVCGESLLLSVITVVNLGLAAHSANKYLSMEDE